MPRRIRRIINRYLPDHGRFREHPHLQRFGARLHDPNLWHLNRRSVSGAVALGVFCAFIPLPFQMILAAALAMWLRVNLPISVALVWLTNPLTMPAVFYSTYLIGCWLLNVPTQHFTWELSWDAMLLGMQGAWKPLLVGSLVAGAVMALLGFVFVRIAWRLYILQQRRHRRFLRDGQAH